MRVNQKYTGLLTDRITGIMFDYQKFFKKREKSRVNCGGDSRAAGKRNSE